MVAQAIYNNVNLSEIETMVPKMQVKELVCLALASFPHHAHERASIVLLLVALADYKYVFSKFVTYFIKATCL